MDDKENADGKARAARLREEIRRISGKKPSSEDETEPVKSPHERIQDRMRELERDERNKGAKTD